MQGISKLQIEIKEKYKILKDKSKNFTQKNQQNSKQKNILMKGQVVLLDLQNLQGNNLLKKLLNNINLYFIKI